MLIVRHNMMDLLREWGQKGKPSQRRMARRSKERKRGRDVEGKDERK